jgi:DnaJ-class molecular chaperone
MPPADWRREMPRTRGEAIEVLGMGVMPGASEAAMKKIVDGLRLSWHPDLAQDEADRQLRELRTKQINAAWDIIQGKRAAI